MSEEQKEDFYKTLYGTFNQLLILIDNEEIEIGKFLKIKTQKDYKIINLIRSTIISVIIILFLAYCFVEFDLVFIGNVLISIYFLFVIYIENHFFYSLSQYQINRKRFISYQQKLNLILNSFYVNKFYKENYENQETFRLINKKINYIADVLKPPWYYIKRYEILAIFSILGNIALYIIQNVDLEIDPKIILESIIALITLCLLLYLYPRISYYRQKQFLGVRNLLEEKLNHLNKLQFEFYLNHFSTK